MYCVTPATMHITTTITVMIDLAVVIHSEFGFAVAFIRE